MGMIYGITGSLMMLFAGLLAARKRVPTWRLGSAQFWLRGHLWRGTLSIVLILFHSGFTFGGALETVLMTLMIVVAFTGLYGLILQHILPRILTSRVPMETFCEQIPYLCQRLQAQSDLLVAGICDKVDCEYESINDAAYNLADSLGKLRNGKEGVDFQKFLAATYVIAGSHDVSSKAPPGQQIPRPDDRGPVDPGTATKVVRSPAEIMAGIEKTPAKPKETRLPTESNVPVSNRSVPPGSPNTKGGRRESLPREPQADSPSARNKNPGRGNSIITIPCPKCARELKLPNASLLGQFGRCPSCQHKFVLQVPHPEPIQVHAEVSHTKAERSHQESDKKNLNLGTERVPENAGSKPSQPPSESRRSTERYDSGAKECSASGG